VVTSACMQTLPVRFRRSRPTQRCCNSAFATDGDRSSTTCVPTTLLGGKTPAEVYKAAPCRPRERPEIYPPGWATRKVDAYGRICFAGVQHHVSDALRGRTVALEPLQGLKYRLWFFEVQLGELEANPDQVVRRLAA
jgi:hypothetical protein